tara:strand:+ start:227 stop:598 length:372 start_codon:yes stop_codon:yes gene_type:complete
MDVFQNLDYYSKRLINIIIPSKSGIEVLKNRYLLLHIFSYFKSGWGIKYQLKKRQYCEYYDIFNELVTINSVTTSNINPYYAKGVLYKIKINSYYVGPVLEWYKTYNEDMNGKLKMYNKYKHK